MGPIPAFRCETTSMKKGEKERGGIYANGLTDEKGGEWLQPRNHLGGTQQKQSGLILM